MNDLNFCPISGETLEPIFDLGTQPIFMGTTDGDIASDAFHQMLWGATLEGIVHLITRLPLDVLYARSHNSGLVGQVWLAHHFEFSKFIGQYKPARVCEIGGGHGILCTNYARHSSFDSWTIYEPNAKRNNDPRVHTINQFFTETTKLEDIDCVVHSHLFEHLYDHGSVLNSIYDSLPSDGLMIFSVPNMTEMVQNGYINALNFEHVTYLPEDLIEFLLIRHGFSIKEKKYFLKDHSIFYCCEKSTPDFGRQYSCPENIWKIKNFFDSQFNEIERINRIVCDIQIEKNIYLFGAHIFSQFYANNGLKTDRIKCILDNDEAKQSKRLFGTNLRVKAPATICDDLSPVVILKAGAYKTEISEQLRKLNPSVNLID